MQQPSPEKCALVIFVSRDRSAGAVALLRKLALKSIAAHSHQRMTSGRPRGPPDSTRNGREAGAGFPDQQD
jgi:hypothetical protein